MCSAPAPAATMRMRMHDLERTHAKARVPYPDSNNHAARGGPRKPFMLTIRDLSKTYANGVKALRDVSLDIPNGMFGLLGPNGAGKSSLMRTIATLQDPDEGTMTERKTVV